MAGARGVRAVRPGAGGAGGVGGAIRVARWVGARAFVGGGDLRSQFRNRDITSPKLQVQGAMFDLLIAAF